MDNQYKRPYIDCNYNERNRSNLCIPDVWIKIGKAAKYSAYSKNIITNYEFTLESNVANNIANNGMYYYRIISNEKAAPIKLVPRLTPVLTNDIVQEKYPDIYFSNQMKGFYKIILNNSSNNVNKNLFGWNYNMGKGSVINNQTRNYTY